MVSIAEFIGFLFAPGEIITAVYAFYTENARLILNTFNGGISAIFDILVITVLLLAGVYLLMAFGLLFKGPLSRARSIPKGKEPLVTVQIPTYNELAALNCAERCLAFEYPQKKMQIIIGDDSNDPAVSAQIDAFAKKHKGRILVTRRGSNVGFKPGNLNHMLKSTKGEIIVIFDSDFLPEQNFLRRIVAPFIKDPQLAVAQARWRIDNFNQNHITILGGTITALCHQIVLPFMSRYFGSGVLCGSAEAIRTSELVKAGGWKDGALTEDIECSLRLIQKGRRFVYLEQLECACEAPFTVKDLCKQQMRWAYGVISAFKLHWRKLLFGRTRWKDKVSGAVFVSGYFYTMLLFLIATTGLLSFISGEPAPINWGQFLSETGTVLLMTSGFLIASIVALAIVRKLGAIPRMIASSLSVGLLVTVYVNVGITKAIMGRQMQWFILQKKGNNLQ